MRCLCLAPDKQPESEQTFFLANSAYYKSRILYRLQIAVRRHWKGKQQFSLRTTMEERRRRKKKKSSTPVAVSVTPSESPLGHLTCKGNEYFVDWVVPSHIEHSFLKSTLVTLDLSCMEVRALGPAEVDWADNSERMLSAKVTPRQLSFHTPCLSDPLKKDARLFTKDSFCPLCEIQERKKKKKTHQFPFFLPPCSHHIWFLEWFPFWWFRWGWIKTWNLVLKFHNCS